MARDCSSAHGLAWPLALALLALSGCNPMTAWTNNQSGKALYRSGRYAAASQVFRRAAIDDPNNPDYLHNFATASRRMGRYAAAEQAYRRALALDPNHQPSYHGLAMTYKETARAEKAYALLTNWAASQPRSAKPLIEMAWLQNEMGDYAGAERSLAGALQVRPGHPLALANLGQLYEETGRTRLAESAYRRALATDWNQPRVASRLQRIDSAQESFPPPFALAVTPYQYHQLSVVPPLRMNNPRLSRRQPIPMIPAGRQVR